jgi:universal stress protein A
MAIYNRIVAAVDLQEDALRVARHARDLAKTLGAELELVHVVKPLLIAAPMPPEPVAPDAMLNMVQVSREAQRQLAGIAAELGIEESQCRVIEGNVKDEILGAAEEMGADLIVIGNRGRQALSLFRRPTDDAVAQKSTCDVLEVRIGQ